MKEIIRNYILEKFITANLEDVGDLMKEELTYAYGIFRNILKNTYKIDIVKDRDKIDDIVLNQMLSHTDVKSESEIVAAIRRLEAEALAAKQEAVNWAKVRAFTVMTAQILGGLAGLYHTFRPHYRRLKKGKVIKENKAYIHRIFATTYLPGAENIYHKIMDKSIKNEAQLKMHFYRLVDRISSDYHELRDFIQDWSPGIKR